MSILQFENSTIKWIKISVFLLQNPKFQWFFIASVQYILNEIEDGNDDKYLRLQVWKEISTDNTNILKMSRWVSLYRYNKQSNLSQYSNSYSLIASWTKFTSFDLMITNIWVTFRRYQNHCRLKSLLMYSRIFTKEICVIVKIRSNQSMYIIS